MILNKTKILLLLTILIIFFYLSPPRIIGRSPSPLPITITLLFGDFDNSCVVSIPFHFSN